MPMLTVVDLLQLALKEIGVNGVGQSVLAEDLNDGLKKLNMMISQWNQRRWLVYQLKDLSVVSTGATVYSIGPAGDFITSQRPTTIESAYVRQRANTNLPIDFSLKVIQSMEDYSRIAVKQATSFPTAVFLNPNWPTGQVFFWPVPQAAIYELHVVVQVVLERYDNLNSPLGLPPEYEEAVLYNLAFRLAGGYQVDPMHTTVALAKAALGTMRQVNTRIPELLMPSELARTDSINIFSGQ